jgi:hypothetical protein
MVKKWAMPPACGIRGRQFRHQSNGPDGERRMMSVPDFVPADDIGKFAR